MLATYAESGQKYTNNMAAEEQMLCFESEP